MEVGLVGSYLDRWLKHAYTTVRRRTADGYASHVTMHLKPAIGHIRLADLTPEHVQMFLTDLSASGLAPATVVRVHSTLRRALSQAERWSLVSRNVARLVQPPRVERPEIEPLSLEQARVLLTAVDADHLRALYAVALALRLRQVEALGLRWSDVDLGSGRISVRYQLQRRSLPDDAIMLTPKAGLVATKSYRSRRAIALRPAIVDELVAHRVRQEQERALAGFKWSDADLVFTTLRGTPVDGATLTRQLHVLLERAGLPDRRWHDLRHSCGSILAAKGVPLPEIQAILGHANLATTAVYLHSLSDSQRAAAQRMQEALFERNRDE